MTKFLPEVLLRLIAGRKLYCYCSSGKKYVEVAAQLQIPGSTAEKQIARFLNAGLLIKQAPGSYEKNDRWQWLLFTFFITNLFSHNKIIKNIVINK